LFVTSEKADQQTDVNKEPEGAILQIFCIEWAQQNFNRTRYLDIERIKYFRLNEAMEVSASLLNVWI
jgi:hypothetical protein